MKTRKLIILCMFAILLFLTACGSNNSGGSGNGEGSASDGSETREPVTISFIDISPSPERTEFFNEMIAKFEEEYGYIEVEMQTVPWDQAFSKLSALGAGGTMPDVINMYPAWLTTFVPAGYLEPLTGYYDQWEYKDNLSDFVMNVSIEAEQRKLFNEVYIIPDAVMSGGLFVRTDWFEEANLELPTTWDEVFEAAEKLTDPEKQRYGWAYRGARAGFDQIFNYIATVTGGETYEEDGTSTLLRPEAIEAFVKFTDLYKKGYAPKDSINWGYLEMVQGFTSGVTGMLNQTTEVVATASKSLEDGTWTVIPFPKAPDGKRYVNANASYGYSISAKSQHKEEAWLFISFLSRPEHNIEYSKRFTMIPIMKDALNDPELANGPMKGFLDTLNDPDTSIAASFGYFPELGEFRESYMDSEVQKYLLDQQTAEETMTNLGNFLTEAQQRFMKENPDVPIPRPIKP